MQNAEQGESTIWSRIGSTKPKDELYRLYDLGYFNNLIVDEYTDPALYKFVEEVQHKGPRFANYSQERLKEFVSRIYELRKNNTDNSTR